MVFNLTYFKGWLGLLGTIIAGIGLFIVKNSVPKTEKKDAKKVTK